jgi:hypothetical protein
MRPSCSMQEAFGIVIFVVVGVGIVLAILSLFFRARLYDEIGRGGLSINEDRSAASPPGGPVDLAERDDEIRQMLGARNARAEARGEAGVDVEHELRRLTAPAAHPELRAEVRDMVLARNARRIDRGEPPLDVEAEVDRQLRELGA